VDIDNYRDNYLALASKRRRLQVRLRGNVPKFLFSPLRKDSLILGEMSNKIISLNDIINGNENKDINIKKDEKIVKNTAGFLKPPQPLNGLKPPVSPRGSFLKPPAALTGLKPPITGTGSNLRGPQGRIKKEVSVDSNINSDQNNKGNSMTFETNFDANFVTSFETNFDSNTSQTSNSSKERINPSISQEFDTVVPIDELMNLNNQSTQSMDSINTTDVQHSVDPIHDSIILATDSTSTDKDNNSNRVIIKDKNNDSNDHDGSNEDENSNLDSSIDNDSETGDNGDNHKENNDTKTKCPTAVVIIENNDDGNYDDKNTNEDKSEDVIIDTDHVSVVNHEEHGKENCDKDDNNGNAKVLNGESNDDDNDDKGNQGDNGNSGDHNQKDDISKTDSTELHKFDDNDNDNDDGNQDEDFIPPSSPRNDSQNTLHKGPRSIFAPKASLMGNLLKSKRVSKVPSVVIDWDTRVGPVVESGSPVKSLDSGARVGPVVESGSPFKSVESEARVGPVVPIVIVDSGAQVVPVVSKSIVDEEVRVEVVVPKVIADSEPVGSGEQMESERFVNLIDKNLKENKSSDDLRSNGAPSLINEGSSDSSLFTPTKQVETMVSRDLVTGIKSMNDLEKVSSSIGSTGVVPGGRNMPSMNKASSFDGGGLKKPSINKASSFDSTIPIAPIETTASRRLAAAILARKKAEEKNVAGELKIPPPSKLQKKGSESKM
jgi:hypothetical protein